MKIKPFISAWVKDFSFDSYDFSTIKDNEVENNFDIGIVGKVFPRVKHSHKGHYINALLWKGDVKCLLLICCGPDSDFSYKTALSLEGLPIKVRQQEGTLYVIKSFDDVIDKEARNNLRDIDVGKKEFVPAVTTAAGPISDAENLGEEEVPAVTSAAGPISDAENLGEEEVPTVTTAAGPVGKEIQDKDDSISYKAGAESELEYIEKNLSKKEIIAGLRIHYFLNSLNLPFFNHGN